MNTSFYTQFITFYWRDALEILFFSTTFYYVALWLRKDKQKNLLWYFYGYCICTCLSYYIQLPVVSTFLLICSPIIMMLFIALHQETLQRNFVALKNSIPVPLAKTNWLEALLRSCLVALNNNTSTICVIEQIDTLAEFLHTPFFINAPVNDDLLNALIASETYRKDTLIWINAQGSIVGMNASWKQISSAQKSITTWQDNALIYTTKTDALIVHADPLSRTFTITIDGIHHENISPHHVHNFIQKYMILPLFKKQKKEKGKTYGPVTKKNSEQQRTT
jgi:DNA integrity scanning protein DisA with diadenylate cyclase activity